MNERSGSRERLEKRRNEILELLNSEGRDQAVELDPDPEEQAIQIEQHEVSVAMVENLRRELAEIEDKLAEIG